jgi:DNA polymerase-3 subunit epsilon
MQNNKAEAVQEAKKLIALKPCFLDTETTGFNPSDEVIDIAIIDSEGAVLLDSLVKPRKAIPNDASAIHGIYDQDLVDAPTWTEIWPDIVEILNGQVLGLYNADFDLRLIEQSSRLNGLGWSPPYTKSFDVMHLFAQFYGDWNEHHQSYSWKKLELAGRHLGIELPNAHRALADALLTREVLTALAKYT